jgi:hypothetical protein
MAEVPNETSAGIEIPPSSVKLNLRAPSKHTYPVAKSTATLDGSPTFEWFSGSWMVSYTSLPLWNDKQNVCITYAKVDPKASEERMPDLDDHVQYQKLNTTKDNSIRGISRPVEIEGVPFGTAYSWRGKGWLRIASSDWEVLGWGKDEHAAEENDWVVTCFSKTMFTPPGIDIYTRKKASLSEETLQAIKNGLEEMADEEWANLVKSIYEVPRT